MTQCRFGKAFVANRPSRIEELVKSIDAILDSGRTDPDQFRKLRGRLLYARAQAFGRFGARAFRALGMIADSKGRRQDLPDECVRALRAFRMYLVQAPPREVRVRHCGHPVVFTDASCEPVAGRLVVKIGGALLKPGSNNIR